MAITETNACNMLNTMSDFEFSERRNFLNNAFIKSAKRKMAEAKFVAEVKAAEESVAKGNYVTSAELHEFLGV